MPPTKEEEKQDNKIQEDVINEESGNEGEASPQKQESKEKKKTKKKKKSRRQGDALDLVKGSDLGDAVSGTAGGVVSGQQQDVGNKQSDHPLSLRLDLNLDVEITLKARVHGDVTLALLA